MNDTPFRRFAIFYNNPLDPRLTARDRTAVTGRRFNVSPFLGPLLRAGIPALLLTLALVFGEA